MLCWGEIHCSVPEGVQDICRQRLLVHIEEQVMCLRHAAATEHMTVIIDGSNKTHVQRENI